MAVQFGCAGIVSVHSIVTGQGELLLHCPCIQLVNRYILVMLDI